MWEISWMLSKRLVVIWKENYFISTIFHLLVQSCLERKSSNEMPLLIRDLLYPFQPEEKPAPEPEVVQKAPSPVPPPVPPAEESDETWEDKEDKLDTESIEPEAPKSVEQKYQYKEGKRVIQLSSLRSFVITTWVTTQFPHDWLYCFKSLFFFFSSCLFALTIYY